MTWPLLSNGLSDVASAENRGVLQCFARRRRSCRCAAQRRDRYFAANLMLNPNVHRTRQHPIKCEWKRGGQFQHGM